MSNEKVSAPSERDLKKTEAVGAVRSARLASVEFATGVADAVASGWRSFRDELATSDHLLDGTVVSGSVEAAATFLEGVARATRTSYAAFEARPRTAPAPAIDYDKLAKLVAAELRKPAS